MWAAHEIAISSASLAVDAIDVGLAFGVELFGLPGGPFPAVDTLLASGTITRSNPASLKSPCWLASAIVRIAAAETRIAI
jgi:hypothetical protein